VSLKKSNKQNSIIEEIIDQKEGRLFQADLLVLEPRILFDGAAIATGVEAFDGGDVHDGMAHDSGAHDAAADISATEKCFWALREKGII